MNIRRTVSINARLAAIENKCINQAITLQGFDLYLRSVEQMLLDKKLVTREELDAIRETVIKEYLSTKMDKQPSNIVIPV